MFKGKSRSNPREDEIKKAIKNIEKKTKIEFEKLINSSENPTEHELIYNLYRKSMESDTQRLAGGTHDRRTGKQIKIVPTHENVCDLADILHLNYGNPLALFYYGPNPFMKGQKYTDEGPVEFDTTTNDLSTWIVVIIIRNNSFPDEYIPPELLDFEELYYLDIVSCSIISIPKEIGFLTNLEALRITIDTSLENFEEGNNYRKLELPEEFSNLQKLKYLDINHDSPLDRYLKARIIKDNPDCFQPIPEVILSCTHLEMLFLRRFPISKIPPEISNLSNLKLLNLQECAISTLPESILELKELFEFNLQENDFASVPTWLYKFHNLEVINFTDNPFNSEFITSYDEMNRDDEDVIQQLNDLQNLVKERIDELDSPNYTPPEPSKDITTITSSKDITFSGSESYYNEELTKMSTSSHEVFARYLKSRHAINVFISHAVVDYETYQIKQLAEYMEQQDEIINAFYCERDLQGNIDDFMNNNLPQSQLVIFIGTSKSVYNSVDCKHELELANEHKIPVIPVKGLDIDWPDLSELGLERELGKEYISNQSFFEDLYEYIQEYKRKADLHDVELEKISKIKLKIESIFDQYVRGSAIESDISDHIDELYQLILDVEDGKRGIYSFFLIFASLINERQSSEEEYYANVKSMGISDEVIEIMKKNTELGKLIDNVLISVNINPVQMTRQEKEDKIQELVKKSIDEHYNEQNG